MAILCLTDESCTANNTHSAEAWAAPALREWLAGDWGMLFSHPGDFQYQGLECDRWLAIVSDEFRACGVRPLACAAGAGGASIRDTSWVSTVTSDWRLVRLGGARPQGAKPPRARRHGPTSQGGMLQGTRRHGAAATDEVVDLAARLLRADITALQSRFVLVVDSALRRRGVLRYSAGRTDLSPLDLLASISALRRQPAVQRAA